MGVYTSNSLIKNTFLPTCTLLILSPFVFLLARALGFEAFFSRIPQDWKTLAVLPQIVLSLVAITLATRIISGRRVFSSNDGNEGKREVPEVPYWIPGLKHLGQFIWSEEGFLKSARDSTIDGIFAYNLAGMTHNVVLSPALVEAALSHSESLSETELITWIIPENAFGMPRSAKDQYLKTLPILSEAYEKQFKEASLNELLQSSIRILEETLPDFITFNPSIVDQMPWERVSDTRLDDSDPSHSEVETNLLSLMNEFLGPAILFPLIGPSFPESYSLLFTDLETFSSSFFSLAIGLPRWFPIPGLPGAHLSRKRLLSNLTTLHNSLINEGTATDAETPTPLTAINTIQSTHNIPIPARAASTLGYIHQLTASTIPLAYWTLLHILNHSSTAEYDPTLLTRLQSETSPYAHATQHASIHPSFPSPVVLSIATPTHTFSPHCPLLVSCLRETERLYATPLRTHLATSDLTITEPASSTSLNTTTATYTIQKGSILDLGQGQRLYGSDPRYHHDPQKWVPDRFLHPVSSSTSQSTSKFSPLTNSADAIYTQEIALAFLAGVIQLWEFSPAAPGMMDQAMGKTTTPKGWRIPSIRAGRVVGLPAGDMRVLVRRKKIKGDRVE